MVRSGIQGGAIACSVLMLYGWAQASASESPPCKPSRVAPSPQSDCDAPTAAEGLSSIPERLGKLGWSNPFGAASSVDQVPPLPDEMEKTYRQVLTEAQAQVKQGKMMDAMANISGIPRNSRTYATAQQLRQDWSRELLRQAAQTYRQAKMERAIALLNAIPTESDRHARAVQLRQQWNREGQLLQRAIAARKAQNWPVAVEALRSLQGTTLFQSAPVQGMLQDSLTRLYEPDQRLLQIASAGMPSLEAVLP